MHHEAPFEFIFSHSSFAEYLLAFIIKRNERDVLRLRLGLDDGVDRSANEVANDIFGGRLTVAGRNCDASIFEFDAVFLALLHLLD